MKFQSSRLCTHGIENTTDYAIYSKKRNSYYVRKGRYLISIGENWNIPQCNRRFRSRRQKDVQSAPARGDDIRERSRTAEVNQWCCCRVGEVNEINSESLMGWIGPFLWLIPFFTTNFLQKHNRLINSHMPRVTFFSTKYK